MQFHKNQNAQRIGCAHDMRTWAISVMNTRYRFKLERLARDINARFVFGIVMHVNDDKRRRPGW